MARLRQVDAPVVEGPVPPAELLDVRAAVWLDPHLFRQWVTTNLESEAPTGRRLELLCTGLPWYRYHFAACGWAIRNRVLVEGRHRFPDNARLEALGITTTRLARTLRIAVMPPVTA